LLIAAYCRIDFAAVDLPGGLPLTSLPGLTRQSMLIVGMKSYWVYVLANRPRGTLYVGMTSDLVRRAYQHREGLVDGFTRQYGVKMTVYYEQHATALGAIQREKNIKHWPRADRADPHAKFRLA
jgi:putative endonuclease